MATTELWTLVSAYLASDPFMPNAGQETSGQAGGQVRVRDLRSMLWDFNARLPSVPQADANDIKALIGSMGISRVSFLAWPLDRQYPKADPTGSIVGASTVQINSLNADNKRLSLKGLPNGYVLSRGDFIQFIYSTTHYALHQVVASSVTANGSGVTTEFEVFPFIRQGAAVNNAVNLKLPCAEFRILPGSYDTAGDNDAHSISFKARQVV